MGSAYNPAVPPSQNLHSPEPRIPQSIMEGYPKLAAHMAIDPEYAIFRKFSALNAQNLLYYQAELVGLEHDLEETAAEDRESLDEEKHVFDNNWFRLSNAEPGKGFQHTQVLKLRQTLKEYSMYTSITVYEFADHVQQTNVSFNKPRSQNYKDHSHTI